MDKLSRQIKTLEVNLHNLIFNQNDLNAKQDKFNRQAAGNILALGRKVFPEEFEKELEEIKNVSKKAGEMRKKGQGPEQGEG